jgi:hypothetical protein
MNDHAEIQQTIVSLLAKAGSASRSPATDDKAALKDIYAQIMAVAGVGYLESCK